MKIYVWKYVWKYMWVKKCVEIRVMLFKNWKYVFEWVYQTGTKCFCCMDFFANVAVAYFLSFFSCCDVDRWFWILKGKLQYCLWLNSWSIWLELHCLVGVNLGRMENIGRKIGWKIGRKENPRENFLSRAHIFHPPKSGWKPGEKSALTALLP